LVGNRQKNLYHHLFKSTTEGYSCKEHTKEDAILVVGQNYIRTMGIGQRDLIRRTFIEKTHIRSLGPYCRTVALKDLNFRTFI
jgi:hypothetical protein